LVVSSDPISEFMKPIVVQVTSSLRLRGFPTAVLLREGEGGLMRESYALCHEIHTLDHRHFSEDPIGPRIPIPRLVEVELAIRHALDLGVAA
jgi:mRNA-degrading endonuclease toxin of MazEF toxin-antitoxin module